MTQEIAQMAEIASTKAPGSFPAAHRPINIAEGFTVDDVKTVDDCDRATALLLLGRRKIEEQIEDFGQGDLGPLGTRDAGWLRRARSSHLLKGIALQQVQTKRRNFAEAERRLNAMTADRAIIAIMRELAPEIVTQAVDLAHVRGLMA